jgi:hypothetical protein
MFRLTLAAMLDAAVVAFALAAGGHACALPRREMYGVD